MDENPEFAAIEQARDLVIDSIAETMDLYGITRSVGILYGTMYMRDEMTLDEMREDNAIDFLPCEDRYIVYL